MRFPTTMTSSNRNRQLVVVCLSFAVGAVSGWLPCTTTPRVVSVYHRNRSCSSAPLCNSRSDSADNKEKQTDKDKKKGYQFGDITRSVLGKFQSGVNSLTGKENYEFGDLTRWIDSQAKGNVLKLDQAAKGRITGFTKRPDYRFGDITREIIRRFQDGEYRTEDLWLFIRGALLVGKQLVPPVAATLPLKVLLELVEVSMAQSVSEDLTGMLTNEINNRIKQFVTGDKTPEFGEIAKKFLQDPRNPLSNEATTELSKKVVGKIRDKELTGNDLFALGGIANGILSMYQKDRKKNKERVTKENSNPPAQTLSHSFLTRQSMDQEALDEFERWEKKYLQAVQGASKSDLSFSEMDQKLVEANKNDDSHLVAAHKSR